MQLRSLSCVVSTNLIIDIIVWKLPFFSSIDFFFLRIGEKSWKSYITFRWVSNLSINRLHLLSEETTCDAWFWIFCFVILQLWFLLMPKFGKWYCWSMKYSLLLFHVLFCLKQTVFFFLLIYYWITKSAFCFFAVSLVENCWNVSLQWLV